ncbi:tetratricopeptide repeat protein [Larkinella sp. GY13]|uniref:tetratricopeptide repeat protein n=1 Tax=Larkinella sp. GY13 TaxID=3453720 RepID=UPI003EE9DF11
MKNFLLLLFLLTVSGAVPGVGQTKIDSLMASSAGLPFGQKKINALRRVAWELAKTRTQLALARQYADSIVLVAKATNDADGVAVANLYYGVISKHGGDFENALDHFGRYIRYFRAAGDSVKVGIGQFETGVLERERGNYEASLRAFQEALRINEAKGDVYATGNNLNSIGSIYGRMQQWDNAIATYRRGLVYFEKEKDRGAQANAYGNMANAYANKKDYKQAELHFQKALAIHKEQRMEWAVVKDHVNIAALLNKQEKYAEALPIYQQTLAIRQKLPNKADIAGNLYYVGFTQLKLKQYAAAKENLLKALAMAEEIGAKPVIGDANAALSEVYTAQDDYQKALEQYKKHTATKDSVMNLQISGRLNELQVKYETGEKDKRIVLLAKEKEILAKEKTILAKEKAIQEQEALRQATIRRMYGIGLVFLCILSALAFILVRQRIKNQKAIAAKNDELKTARFQRELSELELKALRAQINPHFLFNCMNSINQMILSGESEKASLYLGKFSKLVRLILENSDSKEISLTSELATIRSYIELEELRFKGKINYRIDVDESIDPEDTYIPSMILQPFVENAIWHGLMHRVSNEPGTIAISVANQREHLTCLIEDNGVGRGKSTALNEQSVIKNKSMGLKITEERLRFLNHGAASQLIYFTDLMNAFNQPAGTRVEIRIPVS